MADTCGSCVVVGQSPEFLPRALKSSEWMGVSDDFLEFLGFCLGFSEVLPSDLVSFLGNTFVLLANQAFLGIIWYLLNVFLTHHLD